MTPRYSKIAINSLQRHLMIKFGVRILIPKMEKINYKVVQQCQFTTKRKSLAHENNTNKNTACTFFFSFLISLNKIVSLVGNEAHLAIMPYVLHQQHIWIRDCIYSCTLYNMAGDT